MKETITIETRHIRTAIGTRIEKVKHNWDTQCAWVCNDGSHCPENKKSGSQLCSAHNCVAG